MKVCSGQEVSTHEDSKKLILKMKVSTHGFEESTYEYNGQFENKGVDTWL